MLYSCLAMPVELLYIIVVYCNNTAVQSENEYLIHSDTTVNAAEYSPF